MNRNCNEICDILGIDKIRTQEIPKVFFCKITIIYLTSPAPRPPPNKNKKKWTFYPRFSDSFDRETSGSIAKCRLFSEARFQTELDNTKF